MTCLLELIGSAFIDTETCTRAWLEIVRGMYTNRTYGFPPPSGLWKFVVRLPVGCSDLFASIDLFTWYKTSFKFFAQDLFCWLLTCVNNMFWISVHWSWNFSSGVSENCQWDVSKPDIQICHPHRFVEGSGEGDDFCDFTYLHQ